MHHKPGLAPNATHFVEQLSPIVYPVTGGTVETTVLRCGESAKVSAIGLAPCG